MENSLKLTIEVDKDIIKGILVLGGGLKDNTPTSEVKKWLDEHDSVELPASLTNKVAEMRAAMATLALLGISKQITDEKTTKEEER